MAAEREIKFKISAEAAGAEKIQKLADEINALAKSGGDASPEFKKLGVELDSIANQSQLITQFAELKNKTQEVKTSIIEAADATAKSAIALKERTAELSKATQAEKSSSDAVAASSTAIRTANVGIREAKADIAAYNAAIASSGKANDEQTKGLAAANVQLKQYKSELANARSELDKVLPAQLQNAEALKLAQVELNKTSSAFDRNKVSSSELKNEYKQSEAALQSVRDKMTAAGVSASELSTEYVKIANNVQSVVEKFNSEKNALESKLAVQKAATEALKASDEAYKQKVATLKGDAQVEQELITLAQSQNKVQLETARNTLAVAKAKRDEKAISEALSNIRSIEIQQSKLTAQGLRQEADSEERLITTKREHLLATNRSTAATESEILAERTAASSKRELATATEVASLRHKDFAVNTEKSGGALSALGGFARSALIPIQGVIAAFAGATEFVRVNVELENIGRTLKAVTGSSQGAKQEMQFVKDVSNKLGLELVGTAKAFSQFAAATKGSSLEGEQTRKIFESVAHAMSVAGRSASETEGALNALGQMVSKGVVQMEELRGQLGDRLPGAMKVAADSAGLTTAQLIKMVENGDVLAEDLLPKLAEGLNKTFKEGADSARTTSQEFNVLRNAVSATFEDIGSSGVIKFFIDFAAAAAAGGAAVGGFAYTIINGLGAALTATGKSLDSFFSAIKNFDFKIFTEGASAAFSEMSVRIGDSVNESLNYVLRFARVFGNVREDFETTANKADKLAGAIKAGGLSAAEADTNWLKATGTYAELRKQLEKIVEVSVKHVETVKAEGEASLHLATIQGDEYRIKAVGIEVAKANQEALQKESLARESVLQVLEKQLATERDIVAHEKVASKDHLKKIEELTQLIAARKEEAEKALAQANASMLLTQEARIEAEVMRDNSGRVGELGIAYQSLLVKISLLREQEKSGVDVSEKLTSARKELATASRLLADATSDLVKNISASNTVKEGENNLAQLSIRLHIEELKTNLEFAKSKGDETAVRRINNEIRKLEAELSKLQSQLLRAEAEATLAIVAAKRDEITARRELTKVEELEFKAQELGAQAKIKQSEIQDVIVKRMSQSIVTTNDLAKSNTTLSSSYDSLGNSAKTSMDAVSAGSMSAVSSLTSLSDHISTTADRYKGLSAEWADWYRTIDEDINGLIDATHRLDEAMGNSPGVRTLKDNVDDLVKSLDEATAASNRLSESQNHGAKHDAQGYATNTDGQRVNATSAPAPWVDENGNWFYTNSDGQLRRGGMQEPVQDSKGNWVPAGGGGGLGSGSATNSASTSSSTTGNKSAGLNTTVNINLNGNTTSIPTTESGAQALTSLFGQLGTDKTRANG